MLIAKTEEVAGYGEDRHQAEDASEVGGGHHAFVEIGFAGRRQGRLDLDANIVRPACRRRGGRAGEIGDAERAVE